MIYCQIQYIIKSVKFNIIYCQIQSSIVKFNKMYCHIQYNLLSNSIKSQVDAFWSLSLDFLINVNLLYSIWVRYFRGKSLLMCFQFINNTILLTSYSGCLDFIHCDMENVHKDQILFILLCVHLNDYFSWCVIKRLKNTKGFLQLQFTSLV